MCEVCVFLMVLRSVNRCMSWHQCNAEGIIESGVRLGGPACATVVFLIKEILKGKEINH